MEGQQNRIEEVRWTPEVAPSYLTGLVAEDGICKKHAAGYFSTCKCENRCGVTYFDERRAVEVECNQSGIYDPGRGVRYLSANLVRLVLGCIEADVFKQTYSCNSFRIF